MPYRIAIADDHPLTRAGLRILLETGSDLAVVAEAGSPDALLSALHSSPVDLLITDFCMPIGQSGDGLEMLNRLRRVQPNLPIVVLTMVANSGIHMSILATGVRGLVDKSSEVGEILSAVQVVAQGGQYVCASFRGGLPANYRDGNWAELSPREFEVLRLFSSGLRVSDIANRLSRSIKTVSTQKTIAMSKLGLKRDRDIFVYARAHGLDG